MSKIINPYLCFFSIIIVGAVIITQANCKKSPTAATSTDSTQPPPPPPPPQVISDSTSYIKRLEEDFVQNNPSLTRKTRAYSFYYDASWRLTEIGIKNYGLVLFDTAVCRLFYNGNNSKPYMIITPDVYRSTLGQPVVYDTTYFFYVNNQIARDSSMEFMYDPSISTYIKRPLRRYYTYPDSTKTIVDWFGCFSPSGPVVIKRSDTLNQQTSHGIIKLKAQFYKQSGKDNFALADGFNYTNFVNPLSRLNISGTWYSVIYTPVHLEVLGNDNHKAVTLSNILPHYLDFYTPQLPSLFYLTGFNSTGDMLSGSGDTFTIQITPWSLRPNYPSQISVGATTALGDRFVYRYYYF
jgi:hypothetical protein